MIELKCLKRQESNAMKKVAVCGVLVALALIFSYIEVLVPMPIAIPGIKLGLANIVVLFSLYKLGIREATFVSIIRVVLSSLLFSGMAALIYGFVGATFALIIMSVLKKVTDLHIVTISILGALCHIIGQLIVAGAVIGFSVIAYYAVALLLVSFFTGMIIGIVAGVLVKRIPIDM